MRGRGRADAAEAVGRRCGDAAHAGQPAAGTGIGAQQVQCQGVRRHPQADTVLTAGDDFRHCRRALEDQGQRAGPEGFREFPGDAGNVPRPAVEIAVSRQMDDQRVIGRPPLGRKDPGDGGRVGGVGAEAIDRLGRKGDQFAALRHDRGRFFQGASTIPIAARAAIATCRARSGSLSRTVKCPILRPGRA
jgi:hypothetical protein